jgi:hypothetical protein
LSNVAQCRRMEEPLGRSFWLWEVGRPYFVEFVGSRKALHVVIVWIKSLCVVVSMRLNFCGLGGWQGLLVAVFGCFGKQEGPVC